MKKYFNKIFFCQPASGFTLLEVMIAVAIISISMVALMGSQAQSVSVADIARFQVTASLLAQKKLAELELVDFSTLVSEEGMFDEPFANYQYQLEVNTLSEDDTGFPGDDTILKSVDLRVTLGAETGSMYHVRTIIMNNKELEQ